MKVQAEIVSGACGIGVLYEFASDFYHYGNPVKDVVNPGGTGYICAGFVHGNELSDKVFAEMEKRGPCVFKTDVRENVNSGNEFYFAVFDWAQDDRFGFNAADEDN